MKEDLSQMVAPVDAAAKRCSKRRVGRHCFNHVSVLFPLLAVLLSCTAAGCADQPKRLPAPPAQQPNASHSSFASPLLQRLADAGATVSENGFSLDDRNQRFTTIDFHDRLITADLLADLPDIEKLKIVLFNGCTFGSDALTVTQRMTHSVRFVFRKCALDTGVLAGLNGATGVGAIQFDKTPVRDESFAGLSSLPALVDFQAGGRNITAVGLRFLERSPKLVGLSLIGTAIDDASLPDLLGEHDLIALDLSSTKITDASMPRISRLAHLKRLRLRDCKITDAGISHLVSLDNVTFLDVGRTLITDDGLKSLGRLRQLETLGLSDTATTDAGFRFLSSLSHLRDLGNDRTQISAEEVRRVLGHRINVAQ